MVFPAFVESHESIKHHGLRKSHLAKSKSPNLLPAAVYPELNISFLEGNNPCNRMTWLHEPYIYFNFDPKVRRSLTAARSGGRLPVHLTFRDQLPNPVSEVYHMDRLPP